MNAETLAALQESIKHWEENVELAKGGMLPRIGPEYCQLCEKFRPSIGWINTDCIDCPIRLSTGFAFCYGTPYNTVCIEKSKEYNNKAKLIAACEAELAFLRSLLPTDEVKS